MASVQMLARLLHPVAGVKGALCLSWAGLGGPPGLRLEMGVTQAEMLKDTLLVFSAPLLPQEN